MARNQPKNDFKKIDRRRFLKNAALGIAAVGISSAAPPFLKNASASGRDHILIGHPASLTGPLSGFGGTTVWMKELAEREINRDGGIYINSLGKKMPVKILVQDTQSDSAVAAERASRLILGDKVDLMLVMHAASTVDPVIGMCERHGTPCLALGSPLDSFIENAPHKWAFQSFWGVTEDIVPIYSGMWDQIPTNKKVGLLFTSDSDGVVWSDAFNRRLPEKGYTVINRGLFPPELNNFEPFISTWKKEGVDIITGCVTSQDWIACWRQCARVNYKPKIATIGKAILFPSVLETLGKELGVGLSTELWWSPHHPFTSPRTGLTSEQLAEFWTKTKGKQWTQPLGYGHAGYELAEDVLKRAQSLDKEAIRQAIAETNLSTIIGPIRFNEKNFCRTPVVGGQWVKSEKYPFDVEIVYNEQFPRIPRTAELKPL